jgi:hypothetical protein
MSVAGGPGGGVRMADEDRLAGAPECVARALRKDRDWQAY